MIKAEYFYFPECKIQQAQFVPTNCGIISLHIKSLKNTPKHYPQYPLLEGKAEFYFGLELSLSFKENKKSTFFNTFNQNLNESPTKLKGKKVSVIILFNPESDKKIDTIGIGLENNIITLYNDLWNNEEINIINQAAKLQWDLQKTRKEKVHKI